MQRSEINIEVTLDDKKVPQQIGWKATDSSADELQAARAMMLSFWDGRDKSALRIDLWTKDMMVDEMGDFFFQMLSGMADTLQRATGYADISEDLKQYARGFNQKFRAKQLKENKAS